MNFHPKLSQLSPPSQSELLYLHSKCWLLVLQFLLMLLIHLLLHSKYREAIWPHSPSSPQMVSLYSPISLLLTLLLQNSPSTIININGIFLTIPFVIHYFSKVQSSSHKPNCHTELHTAPKRKMACSQPEMIFYEILK